MEIPDFLIVGAAKSGTSSLHTYLSEHPMICMPTKTKELNFWHTLNHEKERAILSRFPNLPTTYNDYKSFFDHRKEQQLCGEASPSYLYYYKDTIDNLKSILPDYKEVKIIIILREPVSKIWSHYKFIKQHQLDPQNLSLEESLKQERNRLKDKSLLPDVYLVDNTKYYEQVKAYQNHFNHVKVLLFEDLKRDTQGLLDEVCSFLNVESFTPNSINKVSNPSSPIINEDSQNRIDFLSTLSFKKVIPAKWKDWVKQMIAKEERMSPTVKIHLKEKFLPEIKLLNSIIDKDISKWLE